MVLTDKRILLIIGGGIAAYKALDLIRRLKERGASVRPVLTAAGSQFVTPLSVGAIAGDRVFLDLFDRDDEHDIGHIRLSREADLIIIAPATANLLAKMAAGLCDDLATTILLASDKPIWVAPAMNPQMWHHPATQRSVEQLKRDGIRFLGPEAGEMAERGEAGVGRMTEPLDIAKAVEAALSGGEADDVMPLAGRRALVTAGPTHEPIDPVRYLANRSSGRQGYAIAAALQRTGADVTLISGPVNLSPPEGVRIVSVETASDMLYAAKDALPVDIAVMAAAVADWRVERESSSKIKKTGSGPPGLILAENPDILHTISHSGDRPILVIGFAAETDDLIANAQSKLTRKGCDWIVANDVSPETGIMGGHNNQVQLVTGEGVESWPSLSKDDVAKRLVEKIVAELPTAPASPNEI